MGSKRSTNSSFTQIRKPEVVINFERRKKIIKNLNAVITDRATRQDMTPKKKGLMLVIKGVSKGRIPKGKKFFPNLF